MKKHNALKVSLITLSVFVLLTWILPAATYQSSYQEIGRSQVGIFDLLSYQNTVLGYFGYVSLFILVIGGFYGVLVKVGAYRKMLDAIVKKFKGKEHICIIIIASLFAILTSFCGMQLALLMLFPFVISLVLMLGYNKLAATAVTAGSVAIGLMGTTFAYSTTQMLQQYLSVKTTTQIWTRIILLVLGLVILLANVLKFGKKESTTSTKDEDDYIPEVVKQDKKKKKNWPLVAIIDTILVVTILGFISWTNSFNVNLFEDIKTAVTGFTVPAYVALLALLLIINIILFAKKSSKKTYIIIDGLVALFTVVVLIGSFGVKAKFFTGITKTLNTGFPVFGKILGSSVPAFGSWTLVEVIVLLLLALVIIKYVYKISWDDMIVGFSNGLRKALLPAFVAFVVYLILVLTTYNPYQLVIYKAILGLTKGFNVFTTGLVAIVSSIINGDPVYAFYNVLPYFVSVVTATDSYPVVSVIFQTLYGIITLVAPTSVTLMVTLAYLKVSYKDWLKYIWKILLELLAVSFIVFTILVLI
ncbi:MAG: hypothetical protein PUB03_00915 [bacterium]|nr:hypothetical protein [bacterium]